MMTDPKFISVDGEGVTRPNGTHDYVLLSVGDASLYNDDGSKLTFDQIMSFLYRRFQLYPDAIFSGFYLSYDFTMWLQGISRDAAYMLLHKDGIALRKPKNRPNPTPFPVRYGRWEFDILANKRFKLRPAITANDPYRMRNVWKWMYICDTGPFWQASFMSTIDPAKWTTPIVTPEEYEIIKEGKAKRATAQFDPAMIKYNITENAVLSEAMGSLRTAFNDLDVRLTKDCWYGPGQAVESWFKKLSVPRRDVIVNRINRYYLQAAMATYYGGWFEIARHGIIPGTSYEYDINSAYPHIISTLPCLLHGKWTHKEDGLDIKAMENARLTMLYVRADGSDPYLGGLPYRSEKGAITRALGTQGWYWAHEVFAAVDAGLIDLDKLQILEQISYKPCSCKPPLAEIANLYNQRLIVGKNTMRGKAIKLLINSCYGKLCQSLGNPKFGNPIYASLIPAGCRTMILQAIASHPNKSRDVLMVATDGIYFRTRHPNLDIDATRLGAWDETPKENMTLFMPGVYWDDKSRSSLSTEATVQIKSRGINGYALAQHIDDIDAQFRDMKDWPNASIPLAFQIVSAKLAISRGKWDQCGQVTTDGSRKMSANPEIKRNPEWYMEDGIITTRPYDFIGVTHGYTKQFGLDIEAAIDNDEYITDDGTINTELMELLGNA